MLPRAWNQDREWKFCKGKGPAPRELSRSELLLVEWAAEGSQARLSKRPCQEFGTASSRLARATAPGECSSVSSPGPSPANRLARVQGSFYSRPHQLSDVVPAHSHNSNWF